jgi:hypothetical protein
LKPADNLAWPEEGNENRGGFTTRSTVMTDLFSDRKWVFRESTVRPSTSGLAKLDSLSKRTHFDETKQMIMANVQ